MGFNSGFKGLKDSEWSHDAWSLTHVDTTFLFKESYWVKTWRLPNSLLNTISPEKSFNQQLNTVLKLIIEYYTSSNQRRWRIKQSWNVRLIESLLFLLNVKFRLIRQPCVPNEECAVLSILFCHFYFLECTHRAKFLLKKMLTGYADCLLTSSQHNLYDIYLLLCVQC